MDQGLGQANEQIFSIEAYEIASGPVYTYFQGEYLSTVD